ncbi:MAG: hypothetical protein WCC45_16690 [Paeniglutamicibacter sp.]
MAGWTTRIGIFVLFNGMLAGAFAIQALAGACSEEESGRLESQLAGSLSRFGWLWAHVLVAGAGSAAMLLVGGYLTGASSQGAATGGDMAAASFAYWPAVLLMLGVLLFCRGLRPAAPGGLGRHRPGAGRDRVLALPGQGPDARIADRGVCPVPLCGGCAQAVVGPPQPLYTGFVAAVAWAPWTGNWNWYLSPCPMWTAPRISM